MVSCWLAVGRYWSQFVKLCVKKKQEEISCTGGEDQICPKKLDAPNQ